MSDAKIKQLEEDIEKLEKAKHTQAISLNFWNTHIDDMKIRLQELKDNKNR